MVLISEYQLNQRNGGMGGLPGATRGSVRETNDDGSSGRPCHVVSWDHGIARCVLGDGLKQKTQV